MTEGFVDVSPGQGGVVVGFAVNSLAVEDMDRRLRGDDGGGGFARLVILRPGAAKG